MDSPLGDLMKVVWTLSRPVVPGGAGGAMPILADQLTLYEPRGANYAHQIILAPLLLESIPISVVCGRCNIGSVRVSARNDRKWKKMKAIRGHSTTTWT